MSGPVSPVKASGRLVVAVPYLWLGLFFLAPFAMVLRIALSDAATALPPYAPHFEGLAALRDFLAGLDLENFGLIWEDPLYWQSYLYSLRIAALTTLIALAIGYPLAYAMASAPARWRAILLVLVILPFWTSFLIRVYAWIGILRPEGLFDMALAALGLSDQPLRLLNTETAVLIGMVYSYLPFMVLPLYATLEKLDRSLLEAAADLGATPLRAFLTVTLPLSLPGILAGSALVFIPAIGEFVIPDLLGGPDTTMIGKVLWTEFFSNRDWPLASAVAVVLLVVLVLPLALLQRARLARAGEAGGRA
ncbi:MAG: ABC transporter permease subunit [Bosea sp. (in: a-proteobacteria)]|uniref:ABC transporter permease n=1 Tax=Bosea sp. (in: a-proteobacteria) TaxID=1871050 RepID=UPI002733F517|nr:ABC transporter permease subunit [Bosea sp. (in: a-proteobacteria)]MDP3599618.1 ABC transporter permease subunit [Bosea sp. (in: a-proteobacteria)]